MKQARRDRQITIAELSELSGVPLGTVQKVFSGVTESPRYKTMRALEDVLKERTGAPNFSGIRYSGGFDEPVISREEPMVYAAVGIDDDAAAGTSDRRYPRQGKYTLEDYLALPAEQRVELIDGASH